MTVPRNAFDTFFLLAAEVWRLYEADQLPQEQLPQAFTVEAGVLLSQSPWLSGSSSSQLTAAVAEEFENPSQHLVDLVQICTVARRQTRGSLTGLCWDGDTGKRPSVRVAGGKSGRCRRDASATRTCRPSPT